MKNLIQHERAGIITVPVPRPMIKVVNKQDAPAAEAFSGTAISAEVDSIFFTDSVAAAQFIAVNEKPTERTDTGMGNEPFYFISALVFVLLAFILVERILFNKTLLSFKNDVKDLAKMRGDFVKLATLVQTLVFNINGKNNEDEEKPQRRFNATKTNVLIDIGELRRLQTKERLYNESIDGLIERKTEAEGKYLGGGSK